MMEKAIPSAIKLRGFFRTASKQTDGLKPRKPKTGIWISPDFRNSVASNSDLGPVEGSQKQRRLALSAVVSDCVRRWFRDTLKEAKSGDVSMQVLVGQMYYNGYGISRNEKKGKAWMSIASRSRSSAWKVSEKRPGYNVSDSHSDDLKSDLK